MCMTYEIVTREDGPAVNVVIRDEHGATMKVFEAASPEHARQLARDCAIGASRQPGVAVVMQTEEGGGT